MTTTDTQNGETRGDEWTKPPFLRRVRIRGYKSIGFCDVALQPLTVLVGRNAAGKSNFLDALAFVRDALATNITEAASRHGGWESILSRMSSDGTVSFELEVQLPLAALSDQHASLDHPPKAEYGFMLKQGPSGSPVLFREWLRTPGAIRKSPHFNLSGSFDPDKKTVSYQWDFYHPQVACSQVPRPHPDRLWLGAFGHQPYVYISDGLRFSGYYNFSPRAIRQPQPRTPGSLLEDDGRNLASLIDTVHKIDASILSRVGAYLSTIVTEVKRFEVVRLDEYDTIRFFIQGDGPTSPQVFNAASMSDGTLRVLAALMAVFQIHLPTGPSIIGIEEPETALHPAGMRALVDALDEATARTQVVLTTHSADLLSGRDVTPGQILVVRNRSGETLITSVDPASRAIVAKELYTLSDLQRMDQLDVDEADLKRQESIRNVAQGD